MSEKRTVGCCRGISFIPLRSDKWGTCSFCIAVALIGTVTGWSFTISFAFLAPDKRSIVGLLAVSILFTLVLLGHAIAAVIRRKQS